MKTSELIGVELDYWVARANGNDAADAERVVRAGYRPSSDWAHGGLILEREAITVIEGTYQSSWRACMGFCVDLDVNDWSSGETYLIAAMRSFVDSKFGENLPE